LRIDRRNSVDGARHGCGRDSCTLCDFSNIHEMGHPESQAGVGNRRSYQIGQSFTVTIERVDSGKCERESTGFRGTLNEDDLYQPFLVRKKRRQSIIQQTFTHFSLRGTWDEFDSDSCDSRFFFRYRQ
jgi:hypothetical protein